MKFFIALLSMIFGMISFSFGQVSGCATPSPSGFGVGGLFAGSPSSPNTPWQSTSLTGACYVQCVGGYSGPTCQIGPTCTFNNLTIAQNGTITGYKSDIAPEGKTCEDISNAQLLICSNGSLAGASTYRFASCLNPVTPPATGTNTGGNQSVDFSILSHTGSLESVNATSRQYITFTLVAANIGTGVATGVKVIYDISPFLEEVTADTLHTLSGDDLVFQLGTMGGETQKTLVVNARVKNNVTGSSLINIATFTGFTDKISTNNSSTLTLPVITLSTVIDTSNIFDPLPTLKSLISRYRDNPQFDCKKLGMSDISNHSDKLYIESMINNCIMKGYQFKTRNAFLPEKTLSRGEWIVMIARVLNLRNPNFTSSISSKKSFFSDVPQSFVPYIAWSKEQGLLDSMISSGSTIFQPHTPIIQQDAKSVLFKIFKLRQQATSKLAGYLNNAEKTLKRGEVPKILIRLFQDDGYLMVGQNIQFITMMTQRIESLDVSKRKNFLENLKSRISSMRSDRLARIGLDKETLVMDLDYAIKGVMPVTKSTLDKGSLQSVTSTNTSTINPWEDLLNKAQ